MNFVFQVEMWFVCIWLVIYIVHWTKLCEIVNCTFLVRYWDHIYIPSGAMYEMIKCQCYKTLIWCDITNVWRMCHNPTFTIIDCKFNRVWYFKAHSLAHTFGNVAFREFSYRIYVHRETCTYKQTSSDIGTCNYK